MTRFSNNPTIIINNAVDQQIDVFYTYIETIEKECEVPIFPEQATQEEKAHLAGFLEGFRQCLANIAASLPLFFLKTETRRDIPTKDYLDKFIRNTLDYEANRTE